MSNLSWANEIGQATTVATYTQFATTSYYSQNLSIINVTPTSPRETLSINIDAFKATWAKLFNPGNDTSPVLNPFMVDAFQFELGFYLRLGMDDFSNDPTEPTPNPTKLYHSAPPILHNCAAVHECNRRGVNIPDDMQATASAALGRWRWKAQLWAVTIWIGIAGILLLSSGGVILWILFQDPVPVNSTAFPSFDTVSLASYGCKFNDPRITPADFERPLDLAKKNTCSMIADFRKTRGYLIRAECETHEKTHVVFIMSEIPV
jgi:hypothetical protein